MNTVIIVLNWKGAESTIKCVNSLKRHVLGPNKSILIVDNASNDGSFNLIANSVNAANLPSGTFEFSEIENEVYILKTSGNLGYAGGNNFAIKTLLKAECNFDAIWILNNDTFVQSNALMALEDELSKSTDHGFVGSIIMDADEAITQCCGGVKGIPFIGLFWNHGRGFSLDKIPDYLQVKFITGASMLISSSIVSTIGLMDESYFLYFEEADWQLSAIRRGYKICIARESVVFHAQSATVGARSDFFYFVYCRSSVIFVKKNFSKILAVIPLIALPLFNFFKTRKIASLVSSLKGAWYGFSQPSSDFSDVHFLSVNAKSGCDCDNETITKFSRK